LHGPYHYRFWREGGRLRKQYVKPAELARRAGVPTSTLRGWEGDRGFPTLPAARRLAAALGVPVERFAEGVEDPGEDEPVAPEKPARPRKRKSP
jgi:transcriptional regulator with XRE-family HTH domain